jgi:hypothetical protein
MDIDKEQDKEQDKELKDNKQENGTNKEREDFEDFLEGDYVNMEDGDKRVLEFRTKGTVVSKRGFKGDMVEKVQFEVTNWGKLKQKKLELARAHARKVYAELQKGFSVLELQRTGSASDTRYIVKGIK